MSGKRSIWASITGGLTSAAPVLLSCCKSGACIGVCASPVASLFGVSSAALANSPIVMAVEPLLIAASAVSFTISYYSLYVLPKSCAGPSCDCAPSAKEKRRDRINKWVFWIGLLLSIGFLGYFEYSKYQAATTECSTTECTPGSFAQEEEAAVCTSSCDSTETCCSENNDSAVVCKLTSAELRERKETVLASLKSQVLERKALPNGYAFRFEGSDKIMDELSEFIKTERACCSFFNFGLVVNGKETWLNLTGPEGTKEMIQTELGL